MSFARVIVDIPTRALAEPFDYAVPDALSATVAPGTPVLVPFGGRTVLGYVVERIGTTSQDVVRDIDGVLGEPLFREWAYPLASWVADETVAPLADAMRLFLPPGGVGRVRETLVSEGDGPAGGRELELWRLVETRGEMAAGEVKSLGSWAPRVAAGLVRDRHLRRVARLESAAGPVDDRWASLVADSSFEPTPRATAQRAVLDALSRGPVKVSELAAGLGAVDAALRRLEEMGAVLIEQRRRMRAPDIAARPAPRHSTLSQGQTQALRAIADAPRGGVVLLDGVTGSGKTEVYLRAIEEVVADGGCATVLVPEISLTPQTVGRFRSRFGDTVAVLHSRLSAGERYDQWDRVRSGESRVTVGPRSALFAPAADLRLVVIDEEHEGSYKQGSAPRYHARTVAERLCSLTGARLVLGSATPSMEALDECERGVAVRVSLPERVAGGTLPPVTVVDMAAEFSAGHRSMFSRALLAALGEVQERREKAVLLLNRRGFAAFVLCRECGFVPGCASCSVSLTYHEVGARLVCHQCGATESLPATCPRCGSPYLRQFGAGTQRVEAELHAAVPDLPVVRMDLDTTRGKGGHQRRLAEFEELGSGVLLGTQMIAKGLDYPEVTLVGVVNADTTLHLPDFRSGERTYQLLEQVAGRAGRGESGGRVIVQTYWPDHPAIRAAASHDAGATREEDRASRTALGYPPYGRLVNVTATGRSQIDVRASVERVAAALRARAEEGWTVLGPSPSLISRVRGAYRWHVMMKAPPGAPVAPVVREALAEAGTAEGVSVAPDIDPVDLM